MSPVRLGGPMDSSNYRNRVVHKLAMEPELPKLTFQVIRRTIATLGKSKGHVKDIQGIMRHSKASTTSDIYMQSLEHEVRTAINSVYDELLGSVPDDAPEPPAASGNSRPEDKSSVAAIAQESSKRVSSRDLSASGDAGSEAGS